MNPETLCSRRVRRAFESRMRDIRTLWNAPEQATLELGSLDEYGLCIDFVKAGTFRDQRAPYWRYQLSWGGPSEEFRVYLNGDVEFWLLDWFDGASVEVTGGDAAIIREIVGMAGAGVPGQFTAVAADIVDCFEEWLRERNVAVPNKERSALRGRERKEAAIIYGCDYYLLEDAVRDILKEAGAELRPPGRAPPASQGNGEAGL